MKGSDKSKLSATTLDRRVRERHLAAGKLDPKALEHHLAELPDLEGQVENLTLDQPALGPAVFGNTWSGQGGT